MNVCVHACTRVRVTPLTIMPTSVSSNVVRWSEEPIQPQVAHMLEQGWSRPAESRDKEYPRLSECQR